LWVAAEKTVELETYTAESVWVGEHAASAARLFTKHWITCLSEE